jgi:hypothetical protein
MKIKHSRELFLFQLNSVFFGLCRQPFENKVCMGKSYVKLLFSDYII